MFDDVRVLIHVTVEKMNHTTRRAEDGRCSVNDTLLVFLFHRDHRPHKVVFDVVLGRDVVFMNAGFSVK